ncbi:MAG: hypothetical protein ABSF44_04425 [Candidatus Bathyarchaeia archaeon]|jgi:hypothetical protein
MSAKSLEVKLCTSCGSTEILENYPAEGLAICVDCGRDVACVPLNVITDDMEEDLLWKNHVCPHCHKTDGSDELLDDKGVVVLKCNACGKLDGYRLLPATCLTDEWINDEDFDHKAVARARNEGHLIFSAPTSAKLAKAIKKTDKDPLTLCMRRFEQVLEEKTEELTRLGVDAETIQVADCKASYFIARNGPFTDKQLVNLLSGALVLAQDKLLSANKLAKRVSERKISELFSADRATTRKWKKC